MGHHRPTGPNIQTKRDQHIQNPPQISRPFKQAKTLPQHQLKRQKKLHQATLRYDR